MQGRPYVFYPTQVKTWKTVYFLENKLCVMQFKDSKSILKENNSHKWVIAFLKTWDVQLKGQSFNVESQVVAGCRECSRTYRGNRREARRLTWEGKNVKWMDLAT